jgi:Zn-finger nucleic acid-binding protein
MSDRQGVEIDYCPSCRGIWLDRGELDKLIQLGARSDAPAAAAPAQHRAPPPDYRARPQFEHSDYGKKHHGNYRRKSWLSDIFD